MKLRQALLVSAKVHRILEYGLRQLMAGKVDFATARREAGLAVRELGFPEFVRLDRRRSQPERSAPLGMARLHQRPTPSHPGSLACTGTVSRLPSGPTHRQWNGLDRENIIDGEPPRRSMGRSWRPALRRPDDRAKRLVRLD